MLLRWARIHALKSVRLWCRIQGRPRKFYLQAMQWILSITGGMEGGMDSYHAGVVFENLWYVLLQV